MDTKAYIDSGILELYVAGQLSEKENQEIHKLMQLHPEITREVLAIEAAIIKLTAETAPKDSSSSFLNIKNHINLDNDDNKIIALNSFESKNNWFKYRGWGASILLAAGLLWQYNQNGILENQIQTVETNKEFLEIQIEKINNDLADTKQILNVLRDENVVPVSLAGQVIYPEAYAKVYWDKDDKTVYLDLKGLPDPPEGKVYQVWSLTLNPLTPTNLGTIDDFKTDSNKIFTLKNTNTSQAFGITLEPVGGSDSPTLEQLYTLGIVDAS